MKIRRAKEHDIEPCVKIVHGAFGEDPQVTRHDLAKRVNDNDYLVLIAEEKNKPVGFITLHKLRENGTLYIERLYVREDARRKGIGSKLLKKAKHTGKKERLMAIFLDTGTSHKYTVDFYTKNKFKVTGFIRDFYMNEEKGKKDAVIMYYKL